MAGLILGAYGYQRSGKTLIAHLLAEKYYKKGIRVYSNMEVPGYIHINDLNQVPLDKEPKVLLLDEVQYFLDSRTWKDNTDSSIFFNSIGKFNILLMLTTIHPDMVEKRIREQHTYVILVKSDSNFIYYRVIDNIRNIKKDFSIRKGVDLFSKCRYDTNIVPGYVNCNLRDFSKRVELFNRKNENLRGEFNYGKAR